MSKQTLKPPQPAQASPPFAVQPWPATTPKLLPLREIFPYEHNPRTHPPEQVSLLARLMKEHGVDQPIVVDENGVVLKGHGRLMAAREAGFETFPVVRHIGLNEAQKKAIRIADNQIALLSGWDQQLLREQLLELKVNRFDLAFTGFDEEALLSFGIGVVPLDEMPKLPASGEPEFSQMTFVLHRLQVPKVLEALKRAQKTMPKVAEENKNKNGLALAFICKKFLNGRG